MPTLGLFFGGKHVTQVSNSSDPLDQMGVTDPVCRPDWDRSPVEQLWCLGPASTSHGACTSPQGWHRVHAACDLWAGPTHAGNTGGQSLASYPAHASTPMCCVQRWICACPVPAPAQQAPGPAHAACSTQGWSGRAPHAGMPHAGSLCNVEHVWLVQPNVLHAAHASTRACCAHCPWGWHRPCAAHGTRAGPGATHDTGGPERKLYVMTRANPLGCLQPVCHKQCTGTRPAHTAGLVTHRPHPDHRYDIPRITQVSIKHCFLFASTLLY